MESLIKQGFMILIVFSLVSCAATREAKRDSKPDSVSEVRIDQAKEQSDRGDPFTIRDAFMQDDLLHIEVSFSGGCAEHEFKLISNQDYNNEYPPELWLFLNHDSKGDRCKSIQYKTLAFDVAKVQHPGSGILTLHVNDYKKPIKYVY
jgi:hypothetical protein